MFGKSKHKQADNKLHVDTKGVIRLVYSGPQTKETLVTIKDDLLAALAEQRVAGKQVKVLADMRGITSSDSGARNESKWFLEEADWDVLAIVGNRYLQPLVFFVLRDFHHSKKIVKYFSDEKRALKWLADPKADANFNRLKPHNRLRWAMIAFILLISASTISSHFQVQERLRIEAQARFDSVVLRSNEALDDRLDVYVEALYGFRGLFHSSEEVNQREYQTYFDSLELTEKYPGLNSVNFITSVTDAEIPAFVEHVRNDRSLRPEGDPGFSVEPGGQEHFIVTYVGVEGVGSARGVDLADNEERRTTLEASRDSGQPVATDTVKLFNSVGQEQDIDGFLITIPVYKDMVPEDEAARRAASTGFINAVFDYQNLFDQALAPVIPSGVAVRVTDSLGTIIYERNQVNGETVGSTVEVPVAGRTWKVELRAPALYGVSRAERALGFYVVAFGVTLAGLLATVLWLQNRGRKRAIDLASAMTEDIKQERNEAISTKNKVEAILSSIGDAVLVLDVEGKIVLFNRAAEFVSGFTAREATGRHFREVLSFTNKKTGGIADDFVAVALAGQAAEMSSDTNLKRKDGTQVPVADSASPVLDADGKLMGAVVVFRDITREKQLEHMKDELLSVASHELRTPMGAVRANVSMILDGDYGPVNKELVEPLTDIKTSTIRLVELVNDLLSVARLEAGRMKFDLSEFDVQEVIRSEVTNLSALGKEKGVEVTFKPTDQPLTVQADADKVRQVLNNLVGNALKFTDEGGITVSVERLDDKIAIEVSDTGIGISKEDQQKLFGKFQQITTVQDGKPAGTGLGLYISREMIRKMGGDLRIKHSQPGKGSIFVFALPLPGSPAADRAKQQISEEAELHPDQR